jgi:hypothetical protein
VKVCAILHDNTEISFSLNQSFRRFFDRRLSGRGPGSGDDVLHLNRRSLKRDFLSASELARTTGSDLLPVRVAIAGRDFTLDVEMHHSIMNMQFESISGLALAGVRWY